ncbi:hypothetical protein FRC04_006253 [Tulasnella sp. 424]|nr:hypothetical protein FRC04_006253 [Tulasnella sp. 424]KAG8961166.1 hypothetical protein FRC05_006278 [Tulasnella sp. 425]
MELTFEDLIFVVPSASSSRSSSADSREGYQAGDNYDSITPMSYSDPSPLSSLRGRDTRPKRQQPSHRLLPPTLPACRTVDEQDSGELYCVRCPGAAHRSRHGKKTRKFQVDPVSRVGKCSDPDCTWGYVDGEFIITDLRGYAYSAEGDPVMYMLPDGATWKHVKLSSARRQS